jgi:hypothetical protein
VSWCSAELAARIRAAELEAANLDSLADDAADFDDAPKAKRLRAKAMKIRREVQRECLAARKASVQP